MNGRSQRIGGRFARGQNAVDHQILLRKANGGEFFMRSRDFTQGGKLRAGNENQAGALFIRQRIDRRLVLRTLFFQPGQWPEAGSIALALFKKAAPGSRQLQQADGMPGRRGVEYDMVKIDGERRVGQQGSEFVECGDFGGTGPGKLFLDALDHRLRQHAAHRADDTVAIGLCRRLRVDLQSRQTGNGLNVHNPVADRHAKYLADVGSRIGADQ